MILHTFSRTVRRRCLPLVLIAGASALRADPSDLPAPIIQLTFDDATHRLGNTGTATGVTFNPYNTPYYSSGPSFGPGVVGSAAVFDGASAVQATSTPFASDFSVAFWMKTTSTGGPAEQDQWYWGAGLVDGEIAGGAADWGVSLLHSQVAFGIGDTNSTIVSRSSVNTGNWVFVAATWTASSHTMDLYIDGQHEATFAAGIPAGFRSDNPFLVGADINGELTHGGFFGSLDQIQIFDTALSAPQVSALQASAIPEPSTYAALAGAAVLGRAGARRRKRRPSVLRA